MNAAARSFNALGFNEADARKLLVVLDHVHLVAILPDAPKGTKPQGKYFDSGIDAALKWAANVNGNGFNVYWTLNYVGPGVGTKPKKADIQAGRGAHSDLDPPKDGATWDKQKALADLAAHNVPPSLVIDSGNGLQPVWLLDQPARDWLPIEGVNEAIRDTFGGDDCHNIDRLLRVPGSVNYPTKAKLERGFVPCMAGWAQEDTGQRYHADKLIAAFPAEQRHDQRAPANDRELVATPTGQLIDAIRRGDNWHNNMLRLTARLVAKGRTTVEIEAMADSLTLAGYTVDETRAGMRGMIEDARRKWDYNEPDDLLHQPEADAKPKKAASAFRFDPLRNLEFRPPEFVIDTLMETSALGLLFGDPGCGKSFLAVDMALCVATGTPFHGLAVKQGAVFYIAGEGHNGLARRFAAWGQDRGVTIAEAPLFVSNRPAQFLDATSANDVAQAVEALAGEYGSPVLIVIDTLARNYGPGDENSTSDMSAFVAAVDDLKARFPGCTVLIVHHSGHAEKGRARGAMALKGALDFEYRLEKE